jgi:hypothetical protein
VYSLLEWIPKSVPLTEIAHPYLVSLHSERQGNWRVIASGTRDEMDALEKLMTASINRELINEIPHTGETDGE